MPPKICWTFPVKKYQCNFSNQYWIICKKKKHCWDINIYIVISLTQIIMLSNALRS